MTETLPRLEVRSATRRFGQVDALRGVDLSVAPGEVMALVGDNGAGKSTLTKLLSGVHRPDSGTIMIDGSEVTIANPQAASALGIETVFQDLALCDNLDAVANLFLGRELRVAGRGPLGRFLADRRMALRARATFDDLGISLFALGRTVGELSGGQRQIIAVGRAALWASRIVLLDEPTAALGVEQTAQVSTMIRGLAARDVSVVVVSHNLAEVFEIADRITVLRHGRRAGVFTPGVDSIDTVIAAITGGNTLRAGRR